MDHLKNAGFENMTISMAEGTGKLQDEDAFVSQKFSITDSVVAKLELVINKIDVDKVVHIISEHGRTLHPGDGIIYVSDVSLSRVYRVKTGIENGIEPSIKNERQIRVQINLVLDPISISLKQIVMALELDPNISISYTRNSYISHLVSEMFVNPIIVRKMVGHSTKKDVTAGYVNLTAKKRLEINSKLLNPEKRYTAKKIAKTN